MQIVKPSYEILYPHNYIESERQLQRIELAARTCYKSEDKITLDSYKKFIKMLVDKEHYAMLGFGEMHVKFICGRGVSHELVRHRLCEFAQESTRYVKYDDIDVIVPQEIQDDPLAFIQAKQLLYKAEDTYRYLLSRGMRQEFARCILPFDLKTEIHMKADFQEWRHIFKLRTAKAAHPQMRELMIPLLAQVKQLIPIVFDDIEVEE